MCSTAWPLLCGLSTVRVRHFYWSWALVWLHQPDFGALFVGPARHKSFVLNEKWGLNLFLTDCDVGLFCFCPAEQPGGRSGLLGELYELLRDSSMEEGWTGSCLHCMSVHLNVYNSFYTSHLPSHFFHFKPPSPLSFICIFSLLLCVSGVGLAQSLRAII